METGGIETEKTISNFWITLKNDAQKWRSFYIARAFKFLKSTVI